MPKSNSKRNQKPLPFEGELETAQFKGSSVRKVFRKGEWFFSIVDVIQAVTEDSQPIEYWLELKKELATQADYPEMERTFVKYRLKASNEIVETATIESIFRIVQSIPSPKADLVKRWLAKVGFERLKETADPELAVRRAMLTYQAQGYPDEWINARIKVIVSRHELTSEWAKRGVRDGKDYAALTNIISKETFTLGTKEHREYKGLKKYHNLRDHMTDIELILTMLGEKSTTTIAVARDARGFNQNKSAAMAGGKIAGDTRSRLEIELGRSVVSRQNYLESPPKQDEMLESGAAQIVPE